MIPLVNHKYKYIFYYNPKSACSSFRKLYLKLHAEEVPDKHKGVTHHKLKNVFFSVKGRDYSNFISYTVVRNPFTRIVSAFLDKCSEVKYNAEKRFRKEHFNKTIHYKIFSYLNRPVDFSQGYTFNEFLDYLMNNSEVDPHFRPQSRYSVNHYYRIEDDIQNYFDIMSEIFRHDGAKLEQVKDFFLRPSNENRSNETFRSGFEKPCRELNFYDKSFDELKELFDNKIKIDYSGFYDKKQVEIVSELFKEDIKNYEYEFPFEL